jgi:hypothetical protein
MSKLVVAGLTAALSFQRLITIACANATSTRRTPEVLSEAVSKALIERRIDVLKITLGLTPEQARYWPAVEEAIAHG